MQNMPLKLCQPGAERAIVDASSVQSDTNAHREPSWLHSGQGNVAAITGSLRAAQSMFAESLRRYVEL